MSSHLTDGIPVDLYDATEGVVIQPGNRVDRSRLSWHVATWDRFLRSAMGWATSLFLHALLLLLACWVFIPSSPPRRPQLWVLGSQEQSPISDLAMPVVSVMEMPEIGGDPRADMVPVGSPVELRVPAIEPVTEVDGPLLDERPAIEATARESAAGQGVRLRFVSGAGLSGRSRTARSRLAGSQGGSPDTERAVELGLAWLAAHQRDDGGWWFDFHKGPCAGRCRNNGTIGTSTGATALAILPFLGSGSTPQNGPYQETVGRGLTYLLSREVDTAHGADFQEGTMYAQGLSALALCEALAMTDDSTYRRPAQEAIDFIQYAQHSEGGWRYRPRQPGDTTVFGWQLMALKSASLAKLDVSPDVVFRAERYLDRVQTEYGAYYGYVGPGRKPTPTAIGLLSRMYLGWSHDDVRLTRGVNYLNRLGPSEHDMYFNYYASLVLHHYGGKPWERWNKRLKPYLIKTQAQQGHERGSWHFASEHANQAGRLYTTAMCTMMLEVYYRYLPLYDQHAVEEGLMGVALGP